METAWSHWRDSRNAFNSGNFTEAIRHAKLAAEKARQEGAHDLEMRSLQRVAVSADNISDRKEAIKYATKLLQRAKELDSREFIMCGNLRMSEILASIDLRVNWAQIRPLMLEGLQIAREINYRWYEIYHLMRLGDWDGRTHDYSNGLDYLQQALSLVTPYTNSADYFTGEIYKYMADIHENMGDHDDADTYIQRATVAILRYGNPNFLAETELKGLEFKVKRGDDSQLVRVQRVMDKADLNDWQLERQKSRYLIAMILLRQGKANEALPYAQESLTLTRDCQIHEKEVESLLQLGEVYIAMADHDTARNTLNEVRQLCIERNYDDHLASADALLGKLDDTNS